MPANAAGPFPRQRRVPEPATPAAPAPDAELRAHVEKAIGAHYELDRELGRGGMGIVYRARDRRLKRTVAIKILPPELSFRSEIRTRFLREAETAAQLNHPNIVPIYSVDEQGGLVYFVMACVEGDNLGTLITRRGALPVTDARRILTETADALSYAHSRNVIHRDIKPDNILISSEDGRAMVTDFGIARAISEGADSRLTATGMAIGTPAYMAPEQAAGEREVDGRTDLYSLGVVGYHMLAGRLPFEASSTPAMLVKHLSETPQSLEIRRPDVPPDMARAVMMLLEKDPANRFPTAAALSVALEGGAMPEMPARAAGAIVHAPWQGNQAKARSIASPNAVDLTTPTADERVRWEASPVRKFRKKLAPYLVVNAAIVLMAIFTGQDFLFVTAFWTLGIAIQYAKLWSDGYDWRDTFKQPRERLLIDVVAESVDDARGLFDPRKRAEMRERARQRRLSGQHSPLFNEAPSTTVPASQPEPQSGVYGLHAPVVMQAIADRDEIARLAASLPLDSRPAAEGAVSGADALLGKVRAIADALSALDRSGTVTSAETIEREIQALEAAANPHEREASEDRVRRLALLKRQRRGTAAVTGRRDVLVSRLESCRLALQNMRLDILRLRTGSETHEHITLVAEQAMILAREVDGALYAADEVRQVLGGSARPANR